MSYNPTVENAVGSKRKRYEQYPVFEEHRTPRHHRLYGQFLALSNQIPSSQVPALDCQNRYAQVPASNYQNPYAQIPASNYQGSSAHVHARNYQIPSAQLNALNYNHGSAQFNTAHRHYGSRRTHAPHLHFSSGQVHASQLQRHSGQSYTPQHPYSTGQCHNSLHDHASHRNTASAAWRDPGIDETLYSIKPQGHFRQTTNRPSGVNETMTQTDGHVQDEVPVENHAVNLPGRTNVWQYIRTQLELCAELASEGPPLAEDAEERDRIGTALSILVKSFRSNDPLNPSIDVAKADGHNIQSAIDLTNDDNKFDDDGYASLASVDVKSLAPGPQKSSGWTGTCTKIVEKNLHEPIEDIIRLVQDYASDQKRRVPIEITAEEITKRYKNIYMSWRSKIPDPPHLHKQYSTPDLAKIQQLILEKRDDGKVRVGFDEYCGKDALRQLSSLRKMIQKTRQAMIKDGTLDCEVPPSGPTAALVPVANDQVADSQGGQNGT